jgi:hypothetical protein
VPSQRRKRQRLGASTTPADRLAAEHPNHVWALDYQFDQTTSTRMLPASTAMTIAGLRVPVIRDLNVCLDGVLNSAIALAEGNPSTALDELDAVDSICRSSIDESRKLGVLS